METSTIIENATSQVSLSLAKVFNTQAHEITRFEIAKLVPTENNPRDHKRRVSPNVERIYKSLQRNGWQSDSFLTINLTESGIGEVLRGNCRTLAIFELKAKDATRFAELFPDGTIPAVVFHKLSAMDKALLLTDHGKEFDRQPLNDAELSDACGVLMLAGYPQEAIAEHLGYFHAKGKKAGKPNREYMQQRCNLARLPEFIRDEFRKACVDQDSSPFRITDVPSLFTAYQADKKEDAKWIDGTGPKLTEAWTKVISATKKATESLSAAAASKAADLCSSGLVKSILQSVTKQIDMPLGELDAKVRTAELDAAKLVEVSAELVQVTMELAAVKAELVQVKAELASLHTKPTQKERKAARTK